MIESDIFPTTGNMASPTISPKLPIVGIVSSMAGITIRRCASINAVYMTGLAGDICVSPCKREARSTVIEIYILPATRIMTLNTVPSKLTVVLVILLMARKTIHRRAAIAIRVATLTIDSCVFSGQLESSEGVIEGPILP